MLAGPDGVGKTTLSRALASGLFADRPVLEVHHRSRLGFLPARKHNRGDGPKHPHRHPSYPAIVSLAKTFYYYVDFLLGWMLRIRPHLRKGGWVIMQRYWWDLAVDPRRYRLRPAPGVTALLGRLLPSPDVTLVLEASPGTIAARKAELPREELERQFREWRSVLPRLKHAVVIDVALPPEQVVASARHAIESISRLRDGERPSFVHVDGGPS